MYVNCNRSPRACKKKHQGMIPQNDLVKQQTFPYISVNTAAVCIMLINLNDFSHICIQSGHATMRMHQSKAVHFLTNSLNKDIDFVPHDQFIQPYQLPRDSIVMQFLSCDNIPHPNAKDNSAQLHTQRAYQLKAPGYHGHRIVPPIHYTGRIMLTNKVPIQ